MRNPKRILIVDDEVLNREFLTEILESLGYKTELAVDGAEALVKLYLDIDLVLLDVKMPSMDGYEVAKIIRSSSEFNDLPIIMVTALSEKGDRLKAVEAGANDFIAKPLDITEVRIRVASLLKMKEVQDSNKRYKLELEETVARRTASLRKALEELAEAQRRTNKAQLETIRRLAIAAEYKDENTSAHIQRVSHYCAIIAEGLHLSPQEIETILNASPMHDVGKMGISDHILLKPGKLTDVERKVIEQHSLFGKKILENSFSDLLKAGEVIALTHHEKWDGSGYPQGLSKEGIPIGGRICAVADVFDALTTRRPYKNAFPFENSIQIIKDGSASFFDPDIVKVFLNSIDEIAEVYRKFQTGNAPFFV